ncbi:MAG: hypothetical protein IH616_04240 [Gemmatimonadales bacterium]|nr:hypothetical protein [Gemmatimonadales bacterium]
MVEALEDVSDTAPFRTCGACRSRWSTPNEFLYDSELVLIGLQVAEHRPESNLLVFEHRCGTSVSLLTSRLREVLPDQGDDPGAADLFGSDRCQLLCRRLDEWAACDRPCVNARDRRLLRSVIGIKGLPRH